MPLFLLARHAQSVLNLEQRVIVCACETCVAVRGGVGPYRPAGQRVVWLPGLDLPDDLWARFAIPIGLASVRGTLYVAQGEPRERVFGQAQASRARKRAPARPPPTTRRPAR